MPSQRSHAKLLGRPPIGAMRLFAQRPRTGSLGLFRAQVLEGSTLDEKYSNLILRCARRVQCSLLSLLAMAALATLIRFNESKRRRAAWADATLWMFLRRRGLNRHILRRIRSLVFAERSLSDRHESRSKFL